MRSLAFGYREAPRILRWVGLLGALWGLPGLAQADPAAKRAP